MPRSLPIRMCDIETSPPPASISLSFILNNLPQQLPQLPQLPQFLDSIWRQAAKLRLLVGEIIPDTERFVYYYVIFMKVQLLV